MELFPTSVLSEKSAICGSFHLNAEVGISKFSELEVSDQISQMESWRIRLAPWLEKWEAVKALVRIVRIHF